jgi:O-antigen/teichoic acid export membrane protein
MKFFLRVIQVVFIRGFGALSAVIVTLLITHHFSPNDAGILLFSISLVAMLGQLLPFGSDTVIMRSIAGYDKTNLASFSKLFNAILSRLFLISVVFIVISVVISFFYVLPIYKTGGFRFIQVLIVFAGASFAIFQYVARAFIGLERAAFGSSIQSIFGPLFFIFGFLLLQYYFFLNLNVGDTFFIYAVSLFLVALGSLCYWFYISKTLFTLNFKLNADIKSSLYSLSVIALVTVIVQYSTQILSVFFLTNEEVASLNVSRRISLLVAFVLIAVNLIVAPKFSKAFKNNNISKINSISLYSGRLLFCIGILVFTFISIFSKQILSIFGNEYSSDYVVLIIFMVGQTVNVATGSVMFILNMTHHEKDVLRITIIMAPIAVVISILFSFYFGLLGVAIASSLLIGSQNLLYVYFVKKRLGFNTLNIFRIVN